MKKKRRREGIKPLTLKDLTSLGKGTPIYSTVIGSEEDDQFTYSLTFKLLVVMGGVLHYVPLHKTLALFQSGNGFYVADDTDDAAALSKLLDLLEAACPEELDVDVEDVALWDAPSILSEYLGLVLHGDREWFVSVGV